MWDKISKIVERIYRNRLLTTSLLIVNIPLLARDSIAIHLTGSGRDVVAL